MSSTVHYNTPPTHRSRATTYQRAKEVISIVKQAREELKALDNVDLVDLNSSVGKVVAEDTKITGLVKFRPSGLNTTYFDSISGTLDNDSMAARLANRNRHNPLFEGDVMTAEYSRSGKTRTYEVKYQKGFQDIKELSGDMKVVENVATGALTVTQTVPEPEQKEHLTDAILGQGSFPADGPVDLSSAGTYKRLKRAIRIIEDQSRRLQRLDNGSQDLNPKRGQVLTAGEEGQYDRGSTIVGQLSYRSSSGEVRAMSLGFPGYIPWSYKREPNGTEHFRYCSSGTALEVTRSHDGAMTWKERLIEREAKKRPLPKKTEPYDELPWFTNIVRSLLG